MKKILLVLSLLLFPINVLAYPKEVILGGDNIGINIKSDGILVVGFYKINDTLNNSKLNIGDYIIKINDQDVNTVDELIEAIEHNVANNKVEVTYRHNNDIKKTTLTLEEVNGVYKTGLYVKDSLNGLGTLVFVTKDGNYCALGHEVLESNTNKRIEVKDGTIYKSLVTSIIKSSNGDPGSKNAKFYRNNIYGTIEKNTISGIYGKYTGDINLDKLMPIKEIDEVNTGTAYIYTTLTDNTVKPYKINILKIEPNTKIKNFYFEVVDEELLEKAGGIVQGMSGSPIVQDNKIIGAVTHVAIDDVKKGYGISIVTMLKEQEK